MDFLRLCYISYREIQRSILCILYSCNFPGDCRYIFSICLILSEYGDYLVYQMTRCHLTFLRKRSLSIYLSGRLLYVNFLERAGYQ